MHSFDGLRTRLGTPTSLHGSLSLSLPFSPSLFLPKEFGPAMPKTVNADPRMESAGKLLGVLFSFLFNGLLLCAVEDIRLGLRRWRTCGVSGSTQYDFFELAT